MYFDYKKKLYNRIFARVRVDNNKTTTDSLNEKKIERKQSGCCFIIYLIVMNIPIMIAYTLDIWRKKMMIGFVILDDDNSRGWWWWCKGTMMTMIMMNGKKVEFSESFFSVLFCYCSYFHLICLVWYAWMIVWFFTIFYFNLAKILLIFDWWSQKNLNIRILCFTCLHIVYFDFEPSLFSRC